MSKFDGIATGVIIILSLSLSLFICIKAHKDAKLDLLKNKQLNKNKPIGGP
jgi:hypothetical protein